MTVSTAPTPLNYNGNGSTTAFPITWKYNAKSHVVATHRSAAGVETVWVLGTNYTLTDPGDSGTLTATVAPATGEKLVITLEPPNTQSSDLPLGGDFPSTTVEDGLDLSAQRDAKVEALFNRALRVPKTDTESGDDLELPIDSERASRFLAFDANGAIIAAAGTSANLGPVTPFIDTLLDDTNVSTAQGTLEIQKQAFAWGGTAGGTVDVITITVSPVPVSYVAGQLFRFVSSGANTGAVTLNVNSLGAQAVTKFGTTALAANDIPSGAIVEVIYDGTRFQLTGALLQLLSRANTFTAVQTFTAFNEAEGSDVAGATTTNVWSTTGNTLHVTGSGATITSLGTASQAGAWRKVIWDGAHTLTHGANLNLQGGVDITTAAGDISFVYADTTTQLDVLHFRARGNLTRGTATATTSGTSHDYTIPAGVKRITANLSGVSTNGTSIVLIRLGDAGGIETTGYEGVASSATSANWGTVSNLSDGFLLDTSWAATHVAHGVFTLSLLNGNTWVGHWSGKTASERYTWCSGSKELSDSLVTFRLTAVNGTDAFDAGSFNVLYE